MRKLTKAAFVGVLVLFVSQLFAEEYGIATFYSDRFQGKPTASGELYDKAKLTAAHKTLPFGSWVKITRLDNKLSVKVRINDRGPYVKGRIVDLSKSAAAELKIDSDGWARVKLEVISIPGQKMSDTGIPKARLVRTDIGTASPVAENPINPAELNRNSSKVDDIRNKETTVKKGNYKDFDLYKIQLLRPEKKGWGVQVASLSKYEHVFKQVAELQESWFNNVLISVEQNGKGGAIYKIILGPFPDIETAKSYQDNLKKKKKIHGFILNLDDLSYPN